MIVPFIDMGKTEGEAEKEIKTGFNFGHINFEINLSGDVEYGWILDIRL